MLTVLPQVDSLLDAFTALRRSIKLERQSQDLYTK